MSIDYYSMRLIADANGISEDSLQQEVVTVKLTDEDALLSSEEKFKKKPVLFFATILIRLYLFRRKRI